MWYNRLAAGTPPQTLLRERSALPRPHIWWYGGSLPFPKNPIVGCSLSMLRFIVLCVCAACCDLKLMDATQQVVIETGRALTPGVYRAVSLRVCTTEETLIQVWTPINSQTFQLKWQTSFTPTNADIYRNWITVIIASNT